MNRPRKHRKDLPRRVYFRHGSHYFVDSSGKWHNLGKDYYQSMIRYAEINTAAIPTMTMGQLFDRYQRDVIPAKAPRTQRDNLSEIRLLRAAFRNMRPGDITPQDVYAYMDQRPPVRANREKALLSHVFSKAIRWGAVSENPCRLVSGNTEKPRDRYVSDEEFWAVHDLAAQVVQIAMKLALITGLRLGDILALKRRDCTDDGLLVETSKTGRRLLFAWMPDLTAAVEAARALPREVKGLCLLTNRKGQRYTVNGFKAMWQRVMTKAVDEKAIGERFQFRDLRAKSGSDHRSGDHLGHADQRTLSRHYRRKPLEVTPISLKVLDKG